MKNLGIAILVIALAVSAYCLFFTNTDTVRIVTFAAVAVFCGLGLIVGDRITGIKFLGLGEIQAAAEKALTDAEQIRSVREDVQAQKNTIESIVREAKKAGEQLSQVEKVAQDAQLKIDRLGEAVTQANQALERIRSITDFSFLLLKATNDDRKSFSSLVEIAESEEHPFKSLATQAVLRIDYEIDPFLNVRVDPPIQWQAGVKPETLSFERLVENYNILTDPRLKPPLLSFIWKQERFSKLQKLDFLSYVIKTETSLRALERACRLMDQEANLNVAVPAAHKYVVWWETHKHAFR